MFSEKLERLIQASLQDGTLTDQEKAAIIKRAQAEGEDVDEVDIYIQSLLQKRQQELQKKKQQRDEQYEKEKKEKIGKVCPKCGKQVPPLTLVCDCGFEFTEQKRLSSVEKLSELLNNITLTPSEEREIEKEAPIDKKGKREGFIVDKKISIISTFPVPNTKEDIVEFLAISISSANKKLGFMDKKMNCYIIVLIAGIIIPFLGWIYGALYLSSKSFAEEKLANAWRIKCEQIIIKGRSLRGDPEFTQKLDYYENLLNQK